MARHASTYRQARRVAWKAYNALTEPKISWEEYNYREKSWGRDDGKRFGPVPNTYIGTPPSRSKYTPHIGAKQRAKGAK